MRKKSLFICCLLIVTLLSPLFAQEESASKKTTYTKTFQIAKIWMSKYGYRVDYYTSTLDTVAIYISMNHFIGAAGKAMLVYGKGPEYPYLSVTWKDGEVDHVTINAVDSYYAQSWGILSGNDDKLKSQFTDEINIKF
jgi:hypothetical protein